MTNEEDINKEALKATLECLKSLAGVLKAGAPQSPDMDEVINNLLKAIRVAEEDR